jgi:DNA-binding protein YbaB
VPGLDEERVRQLTAQAVQMAEKAKDAARRINEIAVEATSRNRMVTVTVGSGGVLKAVRPGPAASGAGAAQLCAAVLEAYGQAAREAARTASEVMQQVTGRDTQVMQAMRAAMPQDDEEGTS